MDLLKPDEVDRAVMGCTFVVHSASPVPLSMTRDKVEQEKLINTMVEGMHNILKAVEKFNIRKLVVTSSTAAVNERTKAVKGRLLTVEDWADENLTENAYTKGKILQEKLAWKFWKNIPADKRFDLVVLCPGNIMGPFYKNQIFGSLTVLKGILDFSKVPFFGYPKVFYLVVDVRDVAYAHLQALKLSAANGKRFLLVGEGLYWQNFAEALHKEFGKYYKITTRRIFSEKVYDIAAIFDTNAATLVIKRGPR